MSECFGAIEAGGTKFICLVGSGPQDIRAETRFPTTTPSETIHRAVTFFQTQSQNWTIQGLGIGSFGPVDLQPRSPTYGSITTTPKPGWANTALRGEIETALGIPVAFDTDVNAAGYGEFRWGAARGLSDFLYLTVGTGIGGGGMVNGRLLHGLVHPEMGHIRLPHDRSLDPYDGFCPFHGDCFEGLAAGPAISGRWGTAGENLPADHPAWNLEAGYIALALQSLICAFSPQRIILGGGVMNQKGLLDNVRSQTLVLLNGYVRSAQILDHIDQYIVAPGLGSRSGVLGALSLAENLVHARSVYLDD